MKIYLIGVGGVGGFYGGLLVESGADITLVGRGESFKAIKEKGVILNCADGVHQIYPVKIIENISEIKDPDLIILAVKSYDLKNISQDLIAVVKPETVVITIQNGLDNDRVVSRYLSNCQVLPGLVLVSTTKTSANTVTQLGTQKKLIFGTRDGLVTKKMREIESVLKGAGIDANIPKSVERELWKKFLFVLAFASATVAQMSSIGEALSNPASLKVYKNVFETTLKGAHDFDPLAKSSLLVDVQKHHQTEVEALHGVLIRLAVRHGLPVPATREIYRKIVE
ncbi:hypothetical protein COT86_01160 [Candidatus Collierbacteria bacterium CG10_big_fil_rev_8_21_14_0_10_43_36]|uniref:Ketopantoate reductase N-terminal domain-containing protein n=3 Tax=Candidatus Collieribacteriota TaxID=1752725 RepID=A0A2H0DUJ6_9BACT|nr:MAG: hypothetical protein COW83_02290 [Candidatus Collierbacteria bacterium CG22_combo_CG10-13_8_21_14_all_43_12]PIR99949.1 MAG: hypothetical protein COT86_01160 [Candidatus Collierbacteria bacterium CG10_big_fil_rev_8_21_14_0_10_43_36]PIZ24806.1 MAG: hypothetical protein COY48_00970 [Candidatus Collierbacteria bacterium CG_4_10_14_0_8_um_filter_43_86]PJB48356.1 MAG: hypothetical protein CO104_01495 [Candidatus Collierbacteria bacterium CG_4_9_14_3_um_filter_43_16]